MGQSPERTDRSALAVPDAQCLEQCLERFSRHCFELLIEHTYLPQGEVYMTKDGVAGDLSLWAPPGKWHASVRSMPPLLPAMQRLMETKHHKEQLGSHCYLAYIGTDPVSQEMDMGPRSSITCCDVQRVPAYLKTTSPRNRSLC